MVSINRLFTNGLILSIISVTTLAKVEAIYELKPIVVKTLQTDSTDLPYTATTLTAEELLDQQTRTTAVSEPIDRLMPLTAHVGLRYTPKERYWIELRGTFADEADKLSTRDESDTQRIPPGGTPGYTIASIYSGFEVTPRLSLFASIENLFDKDYRVHGSGQNEAGRNFILSGRYRF